MDQKELISIVVPTFNSEIYIKKCVKTILNQSYKNFEIIIVDNNSCDNTIKIINSFNSKKIKILNVINHGNISISRNLGIKYAKGNWIAFLDSDDFWENRKLEIVCTKFRDYDLIFHDMKILQKNKIVKNFNYLTSKFDIKGFSMIEKLCINGNPILNSSVIVKKSILEKVSFLSLDQPSFINDFHTWLKISLISNKFYFEKKKLGTYLIHDLNYSHNIKNSYYYLKCVTQFKKYLSQKAKNKIIGYYNYEKGKELIKNGNKKGIKCFFKSFLLSSFEIKLKSLSKIIIWSFKILIFKIKR